MRAGASGAIAGEQSGQRGLKRFTHWDDLLLGVAGISHEIQAEQLLMIRNGRS